MNKCLTIAALLSVLSSGMLYGTFEFRSPISVARGVMHWPLMPAYNAWWYDMMPNDKEESKWNIHTWSAAYYRCADKAFFNVEKNQNTRKTTSLSTLFFGKEVFRGEEAFAGGTLATDPILLAQTNPFLGFARIMPRFDYNEHGAIWGLHVDRRFGEDEKWHAGGKINLPFKVIEIEQNSNCKLEEIIGDVIRTRQLNLDIPDGIDATRIEFAARLDFVNSLIRNGTTLVRFPPDVVGITIAGRQVVGDTDADTDDIPAAYVIKQDNGELPKAPFRRTPNDVTGALGADGSGADGATLFFQTNIDYQNNLFKNREAQGKVFLVSRQNLNNVGVPTDDVNDGSRGIVTDLLEQLFTSSGAFSETASEFFRARGIDLCAHERIAALGDIEAETYVGYGNRDNWFVDGIFGVRLPTGKKNKDSNRLFFQSTGHNRHFEVKLALEGGWMPYEWFAFKVDASFHHAFRRTEKRAALFKGATIRNIGPEIDTRVSWNYFIVHGDLNFFHPHNPDIGSVIGYELFAKRNDNVSFKDVTTATDLFERDNQELDAEAFEKRTNSMSHKFRGEIFHRWNFFEIFAGASHIVAGRNVMKETEGHVGFAMYF